MSGAVFFAGAVSLGLEIVASRVLAPFFGNSLNVWGALIGVVLTGLSVGYWVGGIIADRYPTPSLLVAILALGALAILLIPVIDRAVLTAIVNWDPGPSLNPVIASVALFAPASIVLACVSPVAVRLRADRLTNLGRTAGRLFSVSTAGSITGTFAAAFWLVPHVGTQKLLAIGAVVLLGVASALAFSEGLKVHAPATAVLAAASVLVAGSFSTATTLTRAEAQNWSPAFRRAGLESGPRLADYAGLKVLFQKDTKYHRLAVVDDPENGVRYLRFDASYQSGMKLADPVESEFGYTDLFHLARLYRPDAKRILLIGLGGGSMPKRWLRDFPDVTMDAIEVDPEVVTVAKKYFSLPDDPRLHIATTDGRIFLKNAKTSEKWDAIFVDAYYADGIPFHLATSEFFDLTRRHLTPGGVLAMNSIGAVRGKQSKLLRSVVRTLQGVYPSVMVHPLWESTGDTPSTVVNNMLVASMQPAITQKSLVDRYQKLASTNPLIPNLFKAIADRWELPVQINDVRDLTDDFAPTDALLLDASPE